MRLHRFPGCESFYSYVQTGSVHVDEICKSWPPSLQVGEASLRFNWKKDYLVGSDMDIILTGQGYTLEVVSRATIL